MTKLVKLNELSDVSGERKSIELSDQVEKKDETDEKNNKRDARTMQRKNYVETSLDDLSYSSGEGNTLLRLNDSL